MSKWPMRPLGELVLPTEQRDPREKPSAEFSYVDIASVDNGEKVILPPKRVIGMDAPSRARKVVRAGDIVVAMVRPNLNAVALVPGSLDGQICSTGFAVLRPGCQLTGGYLFAFVRSREFISHLVARTAGANYPAVTDGDVKLARIPLPPLAEQERIVKLLDEADGLRKLRAQADRRTADLLPALFHDMFGDLRSARHNYPVRPLQDLVSNGFQNGLYKHSSFYGAGTPILRIDAFYDGEVTDIGSLKRVRATAEEVRLYSLRRHDIVVNRVNSPDYLGKSAHIAVVPEPTIFESNMMRFAVATDSLDPYYLIHFLQTPTAKRHILSHAKHSINQSSVNQRDLGCLPVRVPPLPLQKEFAQRVSEIRQLEAAQGTSRARLDALFQSMLHRAFNGEL